MAKLHRSVPRGKFGKGTQTYKDATTGLKQSMRKNYLAKARKAFTKKVNEDIAEIHSVEITDDGIYFFDKEHDLVKLMQA